MPGPTPRPAAERRRRNRVAGARKLSLAAAAELEVPELPAVREWHPLTLAWWADVWRSPMAPEFDSSDIHGLYVLAALVDKFWRNPAKEEAAEIRLQRQCFGLSPIDRRRLQWEIDRGEEAEQRRESRRRPKAVVDPRKAAGGSKRAASGGGTGA